MTESSIARSSSQPCPDTLQTGSRAACRSSSRASLRRRCGRPQRTRAGGPVRRPADGSQIRTRRRRSIAAVSSLTGDRASRCDVERRACSAAAQSTRAARRRSRRHRRSRAPGDRRRTRPGARPRRMRSKLRHDHRLVAAFGELPRAVDEEQAGDRPSADRAFRSDGRAGGARPRASTTPYIVVRRAEGRVSGIALRPESSRTRTATTRRRPSRHPRAPAASNSRCRRGNVDRRAFDLRVTPGVLCFSAARCTSRFAPSHASRSSAGDIDSSDLSIRSRSTSSRFQSPVRSSSSPRTVQPSPTRRSTR